MVAIERVAGDAGGQVVAYRKHEQNKGFIKQRQMSPEVLDRDPPNNGCS